MHQLVIILVTAVSFTESYNVYCDLYCGHLKNTVCIREPCSLSKKYCPEGARIVPMSKEERESVLHSHNNYRNIFASGDNGNNPVANMMALKYTTELEVSAQCWANSCILKYDSCAKTPAFDSIGQNIYKDSDDETNSFLNAVNGWYSEISFANRSAMHIYNIKSKSTNHLTQLIWAKSTHMGCGRTFMGEITFVVCYYSPKGNILGEQVYQEGKPCSNCTCSERYPSLCGSEGVKEDFKVKFYSAGHNSLRDGILLFITNLLLFQS